MVKTGASGKAAIGVLAVSVVGGLAGYAFYMRQQTLLTEIAIHRERDRQVVVDNQLTLVMPPWVYGRALADILTGNTGSASVDQMIAHFNLWLGTERGSVPVHAAALAVLLWATITAKTYTVRLLATVTCALQLTLMFWRPESRFGLLAWLMTVITILAFAWQRLAARSAPATA
ncbi:MAG: hypothetical protein DI543_15725 [Bradyrhizobium icense]|nr:MAG: hypothetical protein DI543_15725 [Bradyrhizobium icense]